MRILMMVITMAWSLTGLGTEHDFNAALNRLVVLSYHDVRETRMTYRDLYAVEAAELVSQFAWLKEQGYTPVSLAQFLAAQAGGTGLPAKPVLLTFDDGYRSFYTHVYPLLKLFSYPAVYALVGNWLDDPVAGEAAAPAHSPLVSWAQAREMTASGLVEVASHTYDLHRGVRANPQGNEMPAAITRQYDPASNRYESDRQYEARVRADLARNIETIKRQTGTRPRAVVWPYGAFNQTVERLGRELGMPVSISLAAKSVAREDGGLHLGRILVRDNPTLRTFAEEMMQIYPPPPVRAVRVDLQELDDVDPQVREEKLSRLLDRIAALGLNTVYLSAFSDTDEDGAPDGMYFPSRVRSMQRDLLSRVTWQLRTRAEVEVYAWLPVMALFPDDTPLRPGPARQQVLDLFGDLARSAPVNGLLFQETEVADDDPDYLELTCDIAREVARHRAPVRLARSLTATAVVNANLRLAAWLPHVVTHYSQIILRSLPVGRGASGTLHALAGTFSHRPLAATAVIFEVRNAGASTLQALKDLQLGGIADLAYAPDDWRHDRPPLRRLRPIMSLQGEEKE